jgi:hypothetical protein
VLAHYTSLGEVLAGLRALLNGCISRDLMSEPDDDPLTPGLSGQSNESKASEDEAGAGSEVPSNDPVDSAMVRLRYADYSEYGPYRVGRVSEWLESGRLTKTVLASWQGGEYGWMPLSMLLETRPPSSVQPAAVQEQLCPRCSGPLAFRSENPERGSGTIVFVLGLLFAPLCVGIPILIWGIVMMCRQKNYWHCRGCGTIFPG